MPSFLSLPYWFVSSATRLSSMAPEATRERASETTSAQGLERKVPLFLVFFLFLVVVVVFFFRGFEFFCF